MGIHDPDPRYLPYVGYHFHQPYVGDDDHAPPYIDRGGRDARGLHHLPANPKGAETGDVSRKDAGKLRFDLIPPYALELLAEVYTIGAAKYEDNGWRKHPMRWGRVYAPMFRHALKWWKGEQRDAVDGQHHLAAVIWACATLIEYERLAIGEDDRT